MHNEMLDRAAVQSITGLSKDSIYRKMRTGDFPLSIRISARRVFWRSKEIEDWLSNRPRYSYTPGSRGPKSEAPGSDESAGASSVVR